MPLINNKLSINSLLLVSFLNSRMIADSLPGSIAINPLEYFANTEYLSTPNPSKLLVVTNLHKLI